MDASESRAVVTELRVQWKRLWRERIVDKMRSEGVANRNYPKLFVDRGTVINATRDYRPPDFVEILRQHKLSSDQEIFVPPSPKVGGWGSFIRTEIRKTSPLAKRHASPELRRKRDQQVKKGGRGWLHLGMR